MDRFSFRFFVHALFCVFMLSGSDRAAGKPGNALPDGVTFVTSVEGIDEYRLENGLRLLLFPDLSKQTTTVNITYLVGSLHEGYGETGMAHLLEHLVFKGSTGHPDIYQELTSHGCRPNGSTWTDRTNYFETFQATSENLEWALDLEADRMVNSFISREDLDSEMTVVRNEFEMGENHPEMVLAERVYSTAFLWHNYGNTTIGARSDIESVPIDRLQAFYRTWYRPENAVLVVAGKFDREQTLNLVHEKFSEIENPSNPLPEVYTVEPAQDGERSVTLRRVGNKQVVALAYHIPAGSHPEFAAVEVLSLLLGDTPSGRLHEALVETGMATSTSAVADRFRDASLLYMETELRKEGSADQVQEKMVLLAETFASRPPTDEEVLRAKVKLRSNWERTLRNSSRAAIRLSEWAALGDWRLMFLYRDRLDSVETDDVVRAARAYLRTENRTVGTYVPTGETARVVIPAAPDPTEQLAGYGGKEAMAEGEDFDSSPENVEASLKRSTLPGGMKLVTLPKKTRGEAVWLSLTLHMGSEESLRGYGTIGDLTGQMLMRGTETRTRQEIQDEIDRSNARMRLIASASTASVSVEATRQTLPDMIELLGDVLQNPAFPAAQFEQILEEALQREEEAKRDPFSRSANVLDRHMSPWPKEDVRYSHTPDEAIEEMKKVVREDLIRFHHDFYGASSAELVVVGDFDPEVIRSLAGKIFTDWDAPKNYEHLVEPYLDRPAILESVETPDKESAVFVAQLRIELRDDHADYPALVLGNFMTGGGFLNSRLATRIRRQDGLSYGVGSFFRADSRDENATFGAYAIYAPQNDEKLLRAFREEIEKILESGFTTSEVSEAKSGWVQSRQVSRAQDRELARRLKSHAEIDRTMFWDSEFEQRVQELTPEEILGAFRRHIDPDKISIVRAGDFQNAGEEHDQVGVVTP